MHFKRALDKYNRPYLVLKGDKKTRLQTAVEAINNLLVLK